MSQGLLEWLLWSSLKCFSLSLSESKHFRSKSFPKTVAIITWGRSKYLAGKLLNNLEKSRNEAVVTEIVIKENDNFNSLMKIKEKLDGIDRCTLPG